MKLSLPMSAAMALLVLGQLSAAAEPNRTGQPGSPPTAAKDPDNYSLAQLCAHKALSPQDQADCKRQAAEAKSEAQKLSVRSTYEARAGLSAETAVGSSKAVDRAQEKLKADPSSKNAEPQEPRTRGQFPKAK